MLARLYKYNFDPNQPRDDHGRWDNGGGSSSTVGPTETQVADASAGDLEVQHNVARTALRAVWQQSQKEGVEYGGFIYRRADGTYGATRTVSGWTGGIGRQEADVLMKEVPKGATITATFHTHVNNSLFSPEERENFSTLDITTSNKNNWDAYLGTAISGRLKYYNVREKGAPTDLGRLRE